jgi:hypothetical protein
MKIYLLLLLSIFLSCSANKAIVKTSIEEIQFGSGGGFTGKEIIYTLNSKGKLTEGGKDLKQIDLKKTLLLFKIAKKFKTYSFNEPQNMYSFIVIQSKDNKNRIVWGLGSTKINKDVTDFYNQLISLTK